MSTELFKPSEPNQLAPVDAPTSIAGILDKAVSSGMSPEQLEKIVALYERVSDRQAAQEFAGAMARFQAKCKAIPKTSSAKISTKSGIQYSYKYAELDTIAAHVRPLLSDEGLSYTWDSVENKGSIDCVCTIRHLNGHSVSARFSCPTDSAASMSGAQKNAAALTYARRQSLIQALGLTTCDPDTDAGATDTITEHQAANLSAMLDEVSPGPEGLAKFLKLMGVEKLSAIPASSFKVAITALEGKRRKGA
jgi:hypothetical protein